MTETGESSAAAEVAAAPVPTAAEAAKTAKSSDAASPAPAAAEMAAASSPIPASAEASAAAKDENAADGNGDEAEAARKRERAAHDDRFNLKVKPAYVLSERSPVLSAPPPKPADDDPRAAQARLSQVDEHGNKLTKSERRKRNRGQNKKRPRDARTPDALKLCRAIARGEHCPFPSEGARKCKFSHDVKAYLADRPADIKEVEGGCPAYNVHDKCEFGLMCRLGGNHLNLATGESLTKDVGTSKREEDEGFEKETKEERGKGTNMLRKEVQIQLRKNSYPFVCKRYFEGKKHGRGKRWEGEKKKEEEIKDDDKKGESHQDETTAKEPNGEPSDKAASPAEPTEKSTTETAVKEDDMKNVEDKSEAKDDEVMADAKSEQGTAVKDELSKTTAAVEKEDSSADKAEAAASSSSPSTELAAVPDVDLSPLPAKTRPLIDFRNKVYVAPLTTVGNLPFRRIMKHFQADITCGEMALATGLLSGRASEWSLVRRHPSEDVFGIQIAAGHPDQITRCCEVLEKECSMDFVDLNMGCPIDLVCDKGAGAALMLRERKLKECLRGISDTLSCPFTIKIRAGWDEGRPIAHKLVPTVQAWEIPRLSAVMLHGRSRLQRYTKLADWDYIAQVAAAQTSSHPRLPLIGNGDIFSYTDYQAIQERDGIESTAMLARGALIKPWLPTEIKESRHWDISATERLDVLKDFVKFGLEHWGTDQQGVNSTRRFLLEWLSFLHRYVPVGLLEVLPQAMNKRPPQHLCGRSDLETLMMSRNSADWVKISEMLLGPVPDGFRFEPKHKANSY